MSLDSKELDRSALESKDRDELVTIATALGTKPAARARKSTIVDLILEMTGAIAPGSAKEASGAEAESSDSTAASTRSASAGRSNGGRTSSPAERSTARTDAAKTSTAGRTSASSSDDEGDSATVEADSKDEASSGMSDSDQAPEGEEPGERAGRRQASATPRDRTNTRGDARDQDSRPRQRQEPGSQGGAGQGSANQNSANQNSANQNSSAQNGSAQNGDLDPGNRRRRRRSRSRENPVAELDEAWNGEPVDVTGYLDLRDDGYGFLRVKGFLPSKDDVYVSVKQVRQFGLRKGDHLEGASRPASRTEKNPALLRIDKVNARDPEESKRRPKFEDLTPLFPDEKLHLEQSSDPTNMTARIVDLIAPIGKGQRGLIVSPPKAGKTTVMKTIAQSIETNNPEVHLIVLLVDERPEEVTDMRRSVKGDVVASTFDRPSDEHTAVAEMTIERAKRMVEEKKDVVIILDGITRLARAYNLAAPATGRIMSGGIDTGALYPPKKFFGAARNIEEGGSLTILATALVETGSKMDEVIFEEFKGTGNMELRLDRRMAERRIYPAIDVDASSTRHEELLFDRKQLQMVWKLRRVLSGLAADGDSGAGLEMLIDRLASFKTNGDFLSEIAKSPGMAG